MPAAYNKAGNLRVLYMLKTFQIKAANNIVREASQEWAKGTTKSKLNAAKKMASLVLLLSVVGAGADEIKDTLLGKETPFSDHVTDNMLQLALLNKYRTTKGIDEGKVISATVGNLLPPLRVADDFADTMWEILTNGDDKQFKIQKYIPMFGSTIYARGTGKEGTLNIERKDLYERIKETVDDPGKRKAVSSMVRDFNKKAREYNKGKVGEDKIAYITSTTIKNIKRRERSKK
jgi:hypothetical protein